MLVAKPASGVVRRPYVFPALDAAAAGAWRFSSVDSAYDLALWSGHSAHRYFQSIRALPCDVL